MTAPDKPKGICCEFPKNHPCHGDFNDGISVHIFEPTVPDKPTPGQIGHELRPEDGPFKVEVDDHSDDCGTVYRLFGPSTSILHKDKDYLDEMAEHHNWGWYQAILSVTGQGQEERDFNFKDALDSALFELLDKCRENCNHGCHTVDDDTAWDECPDHKFMTDEIDKLRKTNWPEVQAHYSKMADELASADKAQDGKGERDEN